MTLELSLGNSGVNKVAILKAILINITNIKAKPINNRDFDIDGFLYKFFETIVLLNVLFYFWLN